MIQSARQKRKKRQDIMGIIGIVGLLFLGAGGAIFLQLNNDELDEYQCSIKNGPNAVTAIIFDKSEMYTNDQVIDIKTSFSLWLTGNEAKSKMISDPNNKNKEGDIVKTARVNLGWFEEGNLIQIYVVDEKRLSQPEGLNPEIQLCVPKDFKDAQSLKNIEGWVENEAFLKADYEDFISKFTSIIDGLLQKAEGNSPIMETFVRISNSESFLKHPTVPHNILIVSDMIQNSENWSHYPGRNQGTDWDKFSSEMDDSIYMRLRLDEVNVQIFYARRQNDRDNSIQRTSHRRFWEKFFKNANANLIKRWIQIDG